MKLGLSNSIKNRVATDWTPSSLSGLQLWLKKGTDITTEDEETAANGDDVYGWSDQSGNNNHATGAADRFTYNEASGGIEGSGDNLLNITQIDLSDFAFWIRVKFDTISSGAADFMFTEGAGTDDFFRLQTSTQFKAKIRSSSPMTWTCSTISTGTFYNIGFERASGKVYAYIGTTEQDSYESNADLFNLSRILASFDGIGLEIIVTNAALSSSDRTNLDTYLTNI